MKKINFELTTACLFLLFSLTMQSAFAQKGFRIGIAGGPQITGMNGLSGTQENTHGWNAGLCAGFNFTSHFGLGLDLRYSKQGQKYYYEFQNINASNTGFFTDKEEYFEKINYLKIPILFTYKSNEDKAVAFIANIGPEMTYITKAEHEIITTNHSVNAIDNYKKTNYGLTLGVGIAIRIVKSLQLNAGIRWDHEYGNSSKATLTNSSGTIQSMAYGADIGIIYLLK